MKVLFFYCSTPERYSGAHYSHAIGYLASVLKQNNYAVSCLLLTNFDKKKIIRKIESFRPNLIAISVVTDQFSLVRQSAEFVFDKYKIPIVMGGPHPTVSPEDTLNIKGVIGVCRGEGEEAFLELAEALKEKKDYTKIKNFWFKNGNGLIKNEPRPRIENLDSLPLADRQIQEEFINYRYAEFMFSRGCPFNCSYCINQFLHKFYNDALKKVTFRSVDNVLKEISGVVRRYNPGVLVFHDDVFIMNIKLLREFSGNYPRYFNLPIEVNAHPEMITKEAVELFKKANIYKVKLGVESGNYYLRKNVLNRGVHEKTIINAANLLHGYNIKIGTFNMLGIPQETADNIEETIALNKKIRPESIGVTVFKPYPGTPIRDYCEKNGLLNNRATESLFDERSLLNQKCISQDEISYYWRFFKAAVRNVKILPLVRFGARYLIVARSYEFLTYIVKKIMPLRIKKYISNILPDKGLSPKLW